MRPYVSAPIRHRQPGRVLALAFCLAAFLAGPRPAGAATWYVDNAGGRDSYDGTSAVPDGAGHGPFATLAAALKRLQTSDRLEIANSGKPYREMLTLSRVGGTAEKPLVVEGHGATIDGLDVVPADAWQAEPDGTFSTPFATNANKIERTASVTTWIGSPQIWFVDGKPAPNATQRDAVPPGALYWDKKAHRLFFRPPAGRGVADCRVEVPMRGTGVSVSRDYVVVRNLRSIHSLNDGFGTSGGIGLVFQGIVAEENCDQGFSAHGGTTNLVEDARLVRNAGSGICDVHNSVSIYRRCVVSENTYESGAYFLDEGFHLLEDCRIERNDDGPQVMASGLGLVQLVNCVVTGREGSDAALVQTSAPLVAEGCTFAEGRTGIQVQPQGSLHLTHSLLRACRGRLLAVLPGAEGRAVCDYNAYELGHLERAGKSYGVETWESYRQESRQDAHSLLVEAGAPLPLFDVPAASPLRRAGGAKRAAGADEGRMAQK